jgi:hypothetical protein
MTATPPSSPKGGEKKTEKFESAGTSGAKGGDVVIQRVVREVRGGTNYPILTKTNYTNWARLMKVKLRARHLWRAIDVGDADSDDDIEALDVLCSAVPPELVTAITDKDTAKEAWDTIKTLRVGDDPVRKNTAQQLLHEFELTTFKDSESVEDYALRLTGMQASLATLGDVLLESKIMEKMLRSVPPRFKQIVVAIRTLLDTSTLSVADLTGRLKVAEESFEGPPSSLLHDGKLYLMEEEWIARGKQREAENNSSGGAGGSSARRGGRRGRGRGRGGDSGSSSSTGPAKIGKDQCRRYRKTGHWARDCPSRPKKEQAHVIQDEEEASLLLVRSTPLLPVPAAAPSPPSPAVGGSTSALTDPLGGRPEEEPEAATTATLLVATSASPGGARPDPLRAAAAPSGAVTARLAAGSGSQVRLVEHKVLVHLSEEEKNRDTTSWVLDTGATNHMSGARMAFAKLDTVVRGSVSFGDGSIVNIKGCRTVLFNCKNGEHR